jgi:hypothetical protein
MMKKEIVSKNIERDCVACGKKLKIVIHEDRTYAGGHFFGKLELGKNKKAEYWNAKNVLNKGLSHPL